MSEPEGPLGIVKFNKAGVATGDLHVNIFSVDRVRRGEADRTTWLHLARGDKTETLEVLGGFMQVIGVLAREHDRFQAARAAEQ